MADYYPLIAKAVTGLEKSTGEARRALYERARTALLAQLRGVTPALGEPEITRERLALEEAIRKVEAEAARRSRNDPPPPRHESRQEIREELTQEPQEEPLPQAPPPTERGEVPTPELVPRPATRAGRTIVPPINGDAARQAAGPVAANESASASRQPEEKPAEPRAPAPEPPRVERTRWTPGGGPSLSDRGLRGYRDVVGETETVEGATAQKTMRAPRPSAPPGRAEPPLDVRAEPPAARRSGTRGEPRGEVRFDSKPDDARAEVRGERSAGPVRSLPSRPSPRDAQRVMGREPVAEQGRGGRAPRSSPNDDRPAPRRPGPVPPIEEPDDFPYERPAPREVDESLPPEPPMRAPSSTVRQEDMRAPRPPRPRAARETRGDPPVAKRPPGRWKKYVALVIIVLLALGFGALAYIEGPALIAKLRGTPGQNRLADNTPRGDPGTGPKFPDRAPPGPYTPQGVPDTAQVAQKVVLYEEDPSDPNGKRYFGSAVWQAEQMPPAPGQKPEVAVRADISIPEQRLSVRWSLRRDTDNGAASHTIEVMFTVPADFPHGSIANIPGVLMKQAESSRGTPLAGLVVKVTNNFFLVGLSSTEAEKQRNIQLLKDRPWFDVPVVYGDGKRAIIAIEKGIPGERAFADAFAAWGE